MTLVRNVYNDLVEKRLWPVAVALVIALVAIPIGLSKSPREQGVSSGAGVSPLAGGWSKLVGEAKPVVSLASKRAKYRRRLARLESKNPFIQQAIPKITNAGATSSTSTTGTAGGDQSGGGTPVPSSPASGETTPSEVKFFKFTATVDFGPTGHTSEKTVSPIKILPSTRNPIVAYMGATSSARKAIFVLLGTPQPSGDGECKPSGDTCNFVYLEKGDVEKFQVTDVDGKTVIYRLELKKINVEEIPAPEAASSKADASALDGSVGKLLISGSAKR